jgi:hypothetical protein
MLDHTLCGLTHAQVLAALTAGIDGARALVPTWSSAVHATADCGLIGLAGVRGSRARGTAIGLQSKGTTLITRKGLAPLNNLELCSGRRRSCPAQAYVQIGANAASHALRVARRSPVPVRVDNMSRLQADRACHA